MKTDLTSLVAMFADAVADRVAAKLAVAKPAPTLISRGEAARRLGVSATTIDRSVKAGAPRVNVGKRVLFNFDALRTWMTENGRSVKSEESINVDELADAVATNKHGRTRRAS